MKKLIAQFIKFGFVGGLCFLIDFGLYSLCNYVGIQYLVSGIIGFTVSVIVNYYLSMRYVFERRNDLSREREFAIFVVLSVIGLVLNEVLLFVCIDGVYYHNTYMMSTMNHQTAKMLAKVFATGIVMLYNFISRKKLLEKKVV